ncbi:MAG: methyltransferase domain-containing protein [Gammaproteobacteria bacterium]|nr:methyltransferase domain-containing protein [Gammaproteobacteria bacterium]
MSGPLFDHLAQRFASNIYDSPKGWIRLQLLLEDLASLPGYEQGGWSVLDGGCGQGNAAEFLLARGHTLDLCDISEPMLEVARQRLQDYSADRVRFHCLPVEQLASQLPGPYDLICLHAVLEWLPDPRAGLTAALSLLKPGGHLSLLFYNRDALEYRHLLHGNFNRLKRPLEGFGGTLTPINPLIPQEVEQWVSQAGLEIKVRTGMRVFFDYMQPAIRKERSFEDVFAMERQYSRRQPFLYLARYIHLLCEKR